MVYERFQLYLYTNAIGGTSCVRPYLILFLYYSGRHTGRGFLMYRHIITRFEYEGLRITHGGLDKNSILFNI